jgi:hypothetical protein
MEFVVDPAKLELLDQMVVDLDRSFGAAPAEVKEVVSGITSAVRLLRNSFKCELSERVAQLVKDGDLDGALKTMLELFPDLKIEKVIEILKLIYNDEKHLRSSIGFVEKLRVEFKREAYEALYENVRLKRDTLRCQKFCCCRGT